MEQFKKAKVVMLPTNKPSKLGDLATYQGKSLAKVIKEGVNLKNTTVQFWNLYIISDDEIKKGDWIITNIHNKIEQVLNNQTSLKFYQERAIDIESDMVILEHYGDILFALGEVDEAMRWWQKSLDAGNESAILKEKIAQKQYIPELIIIEQDEKK